jgi:DNA-binding NtrC family response regulator
VSEQRTVLVVDDEVGSQESLRAILQPEYQVLIATEGEQALHLVAQRPVDVALLDLRMPGLSGMQVLEKIKAIDPAIVVIIITAYASEETVREGDRLQVFAIITKPFSVSHLREAVRRVVAHRSH